MIYVTFTRFKQRFAVECNDEEQARGLYMDAAYDNMYKNVHISRRCIPRRCTILTEEEYYSKI